MEPKNRLTTLVELHDQTLWKLLEATAMWRSQKKSAEKDPTRVVKEIMDPKAMQVRPVLITEMVVKNGEAVESLEALLEEIEIMIEEEKESPAKPVGVEKP